MVFLVCKCKVINNAYSFSSILVSNDYKDISGVFFRVQGIALQKAAYKVTVSYVETRSVQKLLRDKFSGRWKSNFELNNSTKICSYGMDNFSEEAVVSSLAGVYKAVLEDR